MLPSAKVLGKRLLTEIAFRCSALNTPSLPESMNGRSAPQIGPGLLERLARDDPLSRPVVDVDVGIRRAAVQPDPGVRVVRRVDSRCGEGKAQR